MTSPVLSRESLSDHYSSLLSGSTSSIVSVNSSEHEESSPTPIATMPLSSPTSPVAALPPRVPSTQPHHSDHFYPGGDIKLIVGHSRTLYQLHADVLARQSGWFRAYRSQELETDGDDALPPGWEAQPGPFCTVYVHFEKKKIQFERPSAYTLDAQTGAIVIEDITVRELDAFLAVLYPTDFVTFGLDAGYVADTRMKWHSVLKVAHLWDCPAIRALAVSRLRASKMPTFERLFLARKYSVDEWVAPALDRLVSRLSPLSEGEIHDLLPGDVAVVTRRREERALDRILPTPPTPPTPPSSSPKLESETCPSTRPAIPVPPASELEAEPLPSGRDSPDLPSLSSSPVPSREVPPTPAPAAPPSPVVSPQLRAWHEGLVRQAQLAESMRIHRASTATFPIYGPQPPPGPVL
ncbi:unnamed protein product [Peniophora sp. CBMAI 1063]|nr:unnamed protein product [Peniophora sp. CBMAI 1063]